MKLFFKHIEDNQWLATRYITHDPKSKRKYETIGISGDAAVFIIKRLKELFDEQTMDVSITPYEYTPTLVCLIIKFNSIGEEAYFKLHIINGIEI